MTDKNTDIEAVFPPSEDSLSADCSQLTSIATEFKDILKNITDMAEEFEAQSSGNQLPEMDTKEENITEKEEKFFEDTNIESTVWESNAVNDVEMSAATENSLNDSVTEAKETYKLFVRNLPPGILSSELLKLFQPYGKVVECEVFVRNYAFVHMESKECGLKAIEELDNKVIKGVQINVQEARNKTIKMKHPIGSYGHQKVTTFKLFLSNLPAQKNHQSIIPMLEPYGRVVEVQTITPTSAFVHIENEECGRKAISGLNGKLLEGNGNKALIISESTEPGAPTIPVMKLLITNVAEKVSASQLRDLFIKYGMVIESKIAPHAQNEERKAIVYLEAIGDIRTALKEMNGYVLEDQSLKVEPLSEAEEKKLEGSLKYKALDPGFGKSAKPKPPPLMQTPTTFRGNRGRPERSVSLRPLFGEHHQKQWRLIPMPSAHEGPSYPYDNYRKPMHLVSPPSRRGRGMGPNFLPRKIYDESEFYTDNYDDFYEPPFQKQQDMDTWASGMNQSYQNNHLMDSPMCDQDYSPLIKKARPRMGQPQQSFHQQNQPTPLMDLPFEDDSVQPRNNYNNYNNNSFDSFRRPAPLNLPLGEKQYFSNFKKVNKNKPATAGNPNIPSLMDTNCLNKAQPSGFQQFRKQPQQQSNDSMAFSQDSFTLPGFYANDQIQGPNSNYWTPPANDADKGKFLFSNMMNNYNTNPSNSYSSASPSSSSNFRQNNPQPQQQQAHFPAGVDPNDYPSLKPGAKVYINGKGKVMVRGNRGGIKTKRPRKPVMAIEMPSRANFNKPKGFMHLNKNKKGMSKQKQDQQKLEYSTWLEQKPWLHQAIPGTIKRL